MQQRLFFTIVISINDDKMLIRTESREEDLIHRQNSF